MRKNFWIIVLFFMLPLVAGCSLITEASKTLWGSSTRVLENARIDAISKTYNCAYEDCFDIVLAMKREISAPRPQSYFDEPEETEEDEELLEVDEVDEGFFNVFIEDRIKKHIVVYAVAGQVDSTEVGIFFVRLARDTTQIDVSSLSSSAKRKVAQAIFNELDLQFTVSE